MGPSRRLHRASVATAVTLVGAATIALGAFEGLGAWIGALLVGGLLGGVATLSAIGIVASSAGVLSPSRDASVDPVTGLNGLHKLEDDLETALADPGSVLHLVRDLLDLRRRTPALRVGPATRVLVRDYPLVFERGGTHVVVANPAGRPFEVELPEVAGARVLLARGVEVRGSTLVVEPFGCAVLERA